MPNISLKPSERACSREDLIAGVEDGLYVIGAGSWSIDQQRDNFQFGGHIFYEIKNGRLGELVQDAAYQGRTLPFWNSLDGLRRFLDAPSRRCVHLRQGGADPGRARLAWVPARASVSRVEVLNTGYRGMRGLRWPEQSAVPRKKPFAGPAGVSGARGLCALKSGTFATRAGP